MKDGDITYNFKGGINLRMIQILGQKNTSGIVFFGSVKTKEDGEHPVFVLSQVIKDKDRFVEEFIILLAGHGIQLAP